MRMNKYLASTLFTGLFITASVFSPALGQEQSLQPQGAWAITKVDRSAQGGNSYCTLSRKYDDGVVLSLGRNQTEEYSLAIDFQKQAFQKDKPLKINLQPGPGQIRAYDMMPTSDKAVVIRLGWDTGFFDALNQSQQMKVKLADKSYSFAMPEIAKGQGELQDCMEGLKSAAKDNGGAQTKDVLNAQAGQSSKDFDAAKADEKVATSAGALNAEKQKLAEQEKGILANFASSVKSQEQDLNNDEAAPRKNFAKTAKVDAPEKETNSKSKAPLPPVADDTDAAVDKGVNPEKLASADKLASQSIKAADVVTNTAPDSTKRAASPTKEKGSDKEIAAAEKLAATSPSAAFEANDKEIAALQKRIADMNAENAALKQKSSSVAPETQKQIDALAAEKKSLQDRLAAAEKERDTKANPQDLVVLESKAKELEIKNAQLEDSLRQSQTRIAETAINTETKSMKQIVDLQSKLEAAQRDNAALAKQMESFKLQQEDGRLNVVAGDWDLEQATKRYNEAEREIRRLGMQLEQERTNCNREKAQIEDMLFDPAVADQKQIQRLSQLQKDLDTAQAKVADNQKAIQAAVDQQLAAKTQTIQSEKTALTQQIATLQKSLADKDASLALEKSGMQNQIAALQKAAAENQSAAAEKSTLSQQVSALQKSLADKDAEKAALQTQMASLQKTASEGQSAAAEKATLSQQVAALQKSLSDKDAEKAALQTQMASLQKTAAEGQSAAAEKNTLSQQVAALQKSLADKEAEKAALQNQMASLKKTATDSQTAAAEKTALSQQLTALQKTLADRDAEKAALQVQMAALQKSAGDVQAVAGEKNVLSQQVATLQKSLADKEAASIAERAAAQNQIADLQKTLTSKDGSLSSEKIALQTQIDALKTSMAQKDQELYALKSQPKMDPAAADQRVAQEVGKAKAAADQEISGLKAQTQSMAQNLDAMKAALAAKDKEIAVAQAAASMPKTDPAILKQIADMQNTMASIQKDNAALRDQNIVLRQESDKLQLQLAEAQTNGGARADRVASVQLELDELKRQMAMKDRQNATYQNQLASQQQENAQLKSRISVSDSNASSSTSEVGELTRQIQSLQNQISDMRRTQSRNADDRSASAGAAYDRITPAAGYVQSAALPVAPVAAQPVAVRAAAASPAPSNMGGYDQSSIQSLLQKSGITPGGIQKAGSGFVGSDNFAWTDSNNVKGLASVRMLGGTDFDTMVNQYIAYQKGQCGGDFASMPSPSNGSAAKRMSLYEVACVSPSQSLSSSLIFFEDQGRFIAISNQIAAADMDIAMDSRDRIAGFVRGL